MLLGQKQQGHLSLYEIGALVYLRQEDDLFF